MEQSLETKDSIPTHRVPYTPPAILHEMELETRAGSDPPPDEPGSGYNPLDPFKIDRA
jgi:hypothetical protein